MRELYNKEISVTDLFKLIDKGEKSFKGYFVDGKEKEDSWIKGKTIEDLTFEDCGFYGIQVVNNTFRNCSFIDCDTGFFTFHNNRLFDIDSDRVVLDFFSDIQFNTFENVKGNIVHETGFNTVNKNNEFINMNFDGFTGIFYRNAFIDGGALSWIDNSFRNTSISLDAISKLSEEARFIWNGSDDWNQSRSIEIVEDVLSEWNGPDGFIIDMEKMNKSAKINLVAGLFTKLCKGRMRINYDGVKISPKSTVEFYTVPNPSPIKIISSDGGLIDRNKMKNINITTPFIPNFAPMGDLSHLLYDGRNLEYLYTEDCDITNPKNYIYIRH